jgi:hypothetical protein
MKILIVQTYYYRRGGDATYGFSLADLLRQLGHEVFFFSMHHPLNFSCKREFYLVI